MRSVLNGTAMNPLATHREIRQARDERQERGARHPRPKEDWGWYSKYRKKDGTIHVMVDKHGNITTEYPHVHVIHDEPGSKIQIVVSRGPKDHPAKWSLHGSSSGNEVNAAIDRARKLL